MPAEKHIYPYPSRFGSHKSMLNVDATGRLQETSPNMCVIIDEYGEYTTNVMNLDNGLADPARYSQSRLDRLFEKSKDRKVQN